MNTTQPDFYLAPQGSYIPITGNSDLDKFRDYGRNIDAGRTIIYGKNKVKGFVVFEDSEIVDDRIYGNLINGMYLDRYFNIGGRSRLFYGIPGTDSGVTGVTAAQLQFNLKSEQYQPGTHAAERNTTQAYSNGAHFVASPSYSGGEITFNTAASTLPSVFQSYVQAAVTSGTASGSTPFNGPNSSAIQNALNGAYAVGTDTRTTTNYYNIFVQSDVNKFAFGVPNITGGVWLSRVVAVCSHPITGATYLVNRFETTQENGGIIKGTRNTVSVYEHFNVSVTPRPASLILCLKHWKNYKWCPKATLEGIPYMHIRARWDGVDLLDDLFAVVTGKNNLKTSFTTGSAWSDNPAVILYDYLTDIKLGLNVSTGVIDVPSFTTAKSVCDENVTLKAGGTEKRYRCNALLSTTDNEIGNIEKILSTCSGKLFLDNGKIQMKAGAWVTPTRTITQDEIIGDISVVNSSSIDNLYNAVSGTFTDESKQWSSEPYPSYIDSTYLTEDASRTKLQRLDFSFTPTHTMAQRLARIWLKDQRDTLSVELDCQLSVLDIAVGDIVNLTLAQYGWTNKTFLVISSNVAFAAYPGDNELKVRLTLKAQASTIYNWTAATDEQAFQFTSSVTVPVPTSVAWNNTTKVLTWVVPIGSTVDSECMMQIQHNGYAANSISDGGENTVQMSAAQSTTDLNTFHDEFGVYVRAGELSYSANRFTDGSPNITPTKIRIRIIDRNGFSSAWVSPVGYSN